MKVLVTGVNGQLGYEVMLELLKRGHEAVGTDVQEKPDVGAPYKQMDITEELAVREAILAQKPDAVVHCAAWTAVDAAEDEENKPIVHAINVDGTKYIASACKEIDCKMIYISTDYVFSGEGTEPWEPDCEDFAPVNYYGQTKLEGEFAVKETLEKYYIVRTSWVFGPHGNNFVKTMLRLAETHDEVCVVNDQIGTPTYTPDLARLLVDMCEMDKYGIYHATNKGGYISWAEFAKEVFRQAGKQTKVIPVMTEEYGLSKAERPRDSRLDKSRLTENRFTLLPIWQDAVNRYLKAEKL